MVLSSLICFYNLTEKLLLCGVQIAFSYSKMYNSHVQHKKISTKPALKHFFYIRIHYVIIYIALIY